MNTKTPTRRCLIMFSLNQRTNTTTTTRSNERSKRKDEGFELE